MHINSQYTAGVIRLNPNGTNSTMFTECCETAICDDQSKCPSCKRDIVGHDAESAYERSRIRWRYATSHWRKP